MAGQQPAPRVPILSRSLLVAALVHSSLLRPHCTPSLRCSVKGRRLTKRLAPATIALWFVATSSLRPLLASSWGRPSLCPRPVFSRADLREARRRKEREKRHHPGKDREAERERSRGGQRRGREQKGTSFGLPESRKLAPRPEGPQAGVQTRRPNDRTARSPHPPAERLPTPSYPPERGLSPPSAPAYALTFLRRGL